MNEARQIYKLFVLMISGFIFAGLGIGLFFSDNADLRKIAPSLLGVGLIIIGFLSWAIYRARGLPISRESDLENVREEEAGPRQ